jgi:hypothetical protein
MQKVGGTEHACLNALFGQSMLQPLARYSGTTMQIGV